MQISTLSRRNILEALMNRRDFYGRFDENIVEFLSQTWDLKSMPSQDPRFDSAAGDIWQHMINNDDWDAEYLYFKRLDMLNVSDQIFLRFLEQLVSPMIRSQDSQQEYVQEINRHLERDGFRLDVSGEISGYPTFAAVALHDGIRQSVKNLIFAAGRYKPEIVLIDAVNNDIQITKNEKYCLVYDRPIPGTGLIWADLLKWWASRTGGDADGVETERALFTRLHNSLASEPERLLFHTYFRERSEKTRRQLPALIPQVYLHYDPYSLGMRGGRPTLPRQRMDFLLLLPNSRRVVIEVDGKQHYANDDEASPRKYAEMVAEDRELKLRGYEVFRFGGYELYGKRGEGIVTRFFRRLFERHGIAGLEPL